MPADDPRIAVGRITRTHGTRGEVAVQPLTEVPSRFDPGSSLQLEDGRTVTVETSRPHADRILIAFDAVGDRTAADALRGAYLFVPVEALGALPEGAYWPHQLEGCAVVTEDGSEVGRLAEVLEGPANDVWAVDGAGGRRLVAAVHDAVLSVDLAARRIVVREGALS